MFTIDIPGLGHYNIEHLVCDYNGTLAIDGRLTTSVKDQLNHIARHMSIHVITADIFSSAERELRGVNCSLRILHEGNQAEARRDLIKELGPGNTAAIGNGRTDRLMLELAAISIAILSEEGCSTQVVSAADILCPGISCALSYFAEPRRLIAVLRS